MRDAEGRETCAWCLRQSPVMHSHHWPIARRDGGAETVEICPTCHATAHNRLFINLMHCRTHEEYNRDCGVVLQRAVKDAFPGLDWCTDEPIPFQYVLIIPPFWMMPTARRRA